MQEDESLAVADRPPTDQRQTTGQAQVDPQLTRSQHQAGVPYPQATASDEHANALDSAHSTGPAGAEPHSNPVQTNAAGLLTDYAIQALQLRSQPFENGVMQGELFADEQTYAQINEIRQAVISGETLLLLLGEEGSGRTTLLKQLTHQSGQRLQYFSVRGGENYTTQNLFNGILDSWKLNPPAELEDTLKELIYSLQATQERNTIVIIMIDDVDRLPANELRLLLSSAEYINSGEDTLLRLVFSAHPEFENVIPDLLPEGSEMPYSALMIEPFHASRAAPYMEFRLNQAGFYEEFPFDERQVNAMANDARGLPGHINAIAAEALNNSYSPFPQKSSRSGFSLAALGGGKRLGKILLGVCGLGLILAGLLYKSPQKSDPGYEVVETKPVTGNPSAADNQQQLTMPGETATAAAANTPAATQGETANTAASNASAQTESRAQQEAATETSSAETPDTKPAIATKPAADKTPAPDSGATAVAPSTANNDDLKAAAAEINAAVAGTKEPKEPKEPKDSDTSSSTPADTKKPEEATKTDTADTDSTKAVTAKPANAETPVKESVDASNGTASSKPATKASNNSAAKPDTVNGIESANWVLLQDPKLYTVQMSASTDRPSVASFLRRGKLEAPNSIFSFQRNGKTWYALVHGLYPNIRDARAAIEKMSKAARSNQPWIREIGRIQQALKDQ